jgi:hypothetical protein
MSNLLMLFEAERGRDCTVSEYRNWRADAGCAETSGIPVNGVSVNTTIASKMG